VSKFDDRFLKTIPPPASGNRISYDPSSRGLGLRVTSAGARAFIFNYRINGRERRMTIGDYGADKLTLAAARKKAGQLRRKVEDGVDPLALREDARKGATVADLVSRVEEQHFHKLRPSTVAEYKRIISKYILPTLGGLKVADVTYTHVDTLHRKISKGGARYRANRTVALLSKMFSLAIRWKVIAINPAKGIDKNQESARQTYLKPPELLRLSAALDAHDDQVAANILRLLLLTGARRGEVQSARWLDLDLDRALWIKPGSTTKQKTEHRAVLSAPAVQLLRTLREAADENAVHVFPSTQGKTGHRTEIKKDWAALRDAAKLDPRTRIHDLRHSYASVLASAGQSLPIIGALLGHSNPKTTQRYSHLFDDPLRRATEAAAAVITGRPSAEIVPIGKGG
jgi:integrase